ncbi:hypothetical protein TNCV_337501 [Trichonephila clavipes]|nr:hypothetical protein TNCV_337501 [Trichonephila clavipes]
MELEGNILQSPALVVLAATIHKTFGPTNLTSTYSVCTRRPSNEETNVIISDNGPVSVDAREAAEALAQHYANESRLAFSSSDKHFARVTRNQIKSCRNRPADNPLFNLISPYPNYLMPFKIWTPTNHLVQIVSLDISCSTLEFWVGKTVIYICNLS